MRSCGRDMQVDGEKIGLVYKPFNVSKRGWEMLLSIGSGLVMSE